MTGRNNQIYSQGSMLRPKGSLILAIQYCVINLLLISLSGFETFLLPPKETYREVSCLLLRNY